MRNGYHLLFLMMEPDFGSVCNKRILDTGLVERETCKTVASFFFAAFSIICFGATIVGAIHNHTFPSWKSLMFFVWVVEQVKGCLC